MSLPELLAHPQHETLIDLGLAALDAELHASKIKAERGR